MCKVVIKEVDSYDSRTVYIAVKEIMLQQRINQLINRDTKILIKPNMLSRHTPDKAVTTNPVVVDSVIGVLKEFGAKGENITLADSSGGPASRGVIQGNYNTCGFSLVAEKRGVNLYTKMSSRALKTDGVMVKKFEVIRPAVESDVIINLAKFKTHVMTGMTGAVKNMFGVVPGLKKAEFHMRFPDKENFANMLVDLCQAVKPTFTIVDGIQAMEGDGPAGGSVRNLGLLLAGSDPYKIDLAMAYIMGFAPENLPVLKAAIDRGLAPTKLEITDITGDVQRYKRCEGYILPRSYRLDFGDHVPRALRWATPAVEKFLAPKPKINKPKCIGCGKCRSICPQKTIEIKDKKAVINLKNCIKCFCCHEMCPVKAIDIKRSSFFKI